MHFLLANGRSTEKKSDFDDFLLCQFIFKFYHLMYARQYVLLVESQISSHFPEVTTIVSVDINSHFTVLNISHANGVNVVSKSQQVKLPPTKCLTLTTSSLMDITTYKLIKRWMRKSSIL